MCLLWLSPGGGGLYLVHQSQPDPLSQRLPEVGHSLLPFADKLGKSVQPSLQGCSHTGRAARLSIGGDEMKQILKYGDEIKMSQEAHTTRLWRWLPDFWCWYWCRKENFPPCLPQYPAPGQVVVSFSPSSSWYHSGGQVWQPETKHGFHPASGQDWNAVSEECFTHLCFCPLGLPGDFFCGTQAFMKVGTQLLEARLG